jgi:hypothetical protein
MKGPVMRGSGGTDGGVGQFAIGFCLAMLALYLFFDSVKVSTAGYGLISGSFHGRGGGHGGFWETTSMGIIFVPFFLGVLSLFYNARMKWAWWLTWIGVAVIAIEILSRVRFLMTMKTTHLLGMMVLFAAGAALMLRSYRDASRNESRPDDDSKKPEAKPKGGSAKGD